MRENRIVFQGLRPYAPSALPRASELAR